MNSRLIFLPVPPDYLQNWSGQEQFNSAGNTFIINPDIPIPAEIPENDENTDFKNLSMEMIQLGLLRAIEEKQAEQEWIDYYCKFLLFLRPDLISKLKSIKDNELTNNNYINAYNMIKDGKYEKALDSIREFLRQRPLVWNGWFILGWALRLMGRWQDALMALKKAAELGGDNSDIKNEIAICYMETGDINSAKHELEAAVKNDPENVKLISNLGVLAFKTGNKEEAAAYFKTALDLDENDPVAKQFLQP